VQRADEKIGPGVENVTVSPHLSIRGVRCFTLLRKDGSVKNFSYRKTLAAMLGDGWEGYQLPELVRLQQLVSAGRRPLCKSGEGRSIDQVPTVCQVPHLPPDTPGGKRIWFRANRPVLQ
jgi:Protein of unknown function (DUF3223)